MARSHHSVALLPSQMRHPGRTATIHASNPDSHVLPATGHTPSRHADCFPNCCGAVCRVWCHVPCEIRPMHHGTASESKTARAQRGASNVQMTPKGLPTGTTTQVAAQRSLAIHEYFRDTTRAGQMRDHHFCELSADCTTTVAAFAPPVPPALPHIQLMQNTTACHDTEQTRSSLPLGQVSI